MIYLLKLLTGSGEYETATSANDIKISDVIFFSSSRPSILKTALHNSGFLNEETSRFSMKLNMFGDPWTSIPFTSKAKESVVLNSYKRIEMSCLRK